MLDSGLVVTSAEGLVAQLLEFFGLQMKRERKMKNENKDEKEQGKERKEKERRKEKEEEDIRCSFCSEWRRRGKEKRIAVARGIF